MTNTTDGTPPENFAGTVAPRPADDLDWRVVADQRLTRLVEVEHDHSVMCDRLALLQVDYREVLVASDHQLRRLVELDRVCVELEGRLAELERMHATFLDSRSWRLTRPLRAVSTWHQEGRHRSGNVLRAMLRVPLFRRVARLMVRLVPGLHARLRSRLYPSTVCDDRWSVH